jgi:hypothetical protein
MRRHSALKCGLVISPKMLRNSPSEYIFIGIPFLATDVNRTITATLRVDNAQNGRGLRRRVERAFEIGAENRQAVLPTLGANASRPR